MVEYLKFYESDLWKEAYTLQKLIFDVVQRFPKEERYGLGSQMSNSSNSVLANIAESHGRFYFADKIRVLYIVRGEMEETQSHLFVAEGRNYVDKKTVLRIVDGYEKLKMKINGQIADYRRKRERV